MQFVGCFSDANVSLCYLDSWMRCLPFEDFGIVYFNFELRDTLPKFLFVVNLPIACFGLNSGNWLKAGSPIRISLDI